MAALQKLFPYYQSFENGFSALLRSISAIGRTSTVTQSGDSPQVVLITGCSEGGLGHALAKEMVKRGCKVFATARTPSKTGDLADLGCEIVKLDVLDPESIKSAVHTVLERTGGIIDILINNAGIIQICPFTDLQNGDFESVVNTNFLGMVRMARAVLPSMTARSSGLIVNIGSALSGSSQPFLTSYAASKAATRSWTEGLAQELAILNIRTILVEPGMIASHLVGWQDPWSAKSGSLYEGLRPVQTFIRFVEGLMMPSSSSITAEEFATHTVNNILSSNPRFFDNTIGGMAFGWWLMECVPRWARYYAEGVLYGLRGYTRQSELQRVKKSS